MTSADAGSIICVLPPVVSNQIAAGEVVTRPASVVKELVENALDARATKVRVEIEAGGTLRIRVTDDGHGMSPADAVLCVERHATSKIRSADDLLDIRTLGFRGEALPSIASVSRFLLRTRRAGDEVGCELQIEGGERAASGPCSCAPGTGVEVAELFFNVPARRKFLRGLSTESAHVTEVVAVAALARPDISFVLLRDGRVAREWLRMPSRPERVAQVLGEPELVTCIGERGPLRVEAYLGRPEHARAGAAGLHFFVNDRPVGDRSLARAVAAAYGPALAPGRYPAGAIFLGLPRELVDVNVHPQKAEVRFAQARAVSDALFSVVQAEISRMLGLPPRPGLGHGGGPPPSSDAWPGSGTGARFPLTARNGAASRGADGADGAASWVWGESAHGAQPQPDARPRPLPDRWVGTVHRRWLVLETADELLVVDAAAAREQVARARLAQERAAGQVPSRPLLFPLVTAASAAARRALETNAEALERLGFELRLAGPQEIGLHAVPLGLGAVPAEALLGLLMRELESMRAPLDPPRSAALLGAAAKLAAAERAAPDEPAEALALLSELRRCEPGGLAGSQAVVWSLAWAGPAAGRSGP